MRDENLRCMFHVCMYVCMYAKFQTLCVCVCGLCVWESAGGDSKVIGINLK